MERNTDTRRFGHYLLIECISRGGVSEVYRAQLDAPGEQETVVLKLLTVNDSRQARSFGAAARLAATLKDPHIVPILEHGTLDGTP